MEKLPRFQTLDELVAFWDEHDFGDYVDEMEEVGEEGLPGQKRPTLHITLNQRVWKRLNELAGRQGVPSDRLVRQWVEERVAHEAAA